MWSRIQCRRAALCGALLLAGLPATSGAAGPEPVAPPTLEPGAPPLAESRYQAGRRLYLAGDYAAAVREFSTALDVFPASAKLAFNLGRSCERLDDAEGAVRAYRRYLENDAQAPDREEMLRLIASLEHRVEAQQPTLAITSEPSGAGISLDEAPPAGATPLTLRVAPGAHLVRLRLPGYQEAVRSVGPRKGESLTLHVPLTPEAPALAPPAAVSPPVTPAPPPAAGWARPVAWGLLGLGAVALGAGGYFAYAAADTADRADGLGRTPAELARHRRLEGEFDDQVTWAITASAVGGGLALGAGLIFLLAPDAAAPSAVSVGLAPGGLLVRGALP